VVSVSGILRDYQDAGSVNGLLADADLHGRLRDPVPDRSPGAPRGFATRRATRTGAAQHTCATCPSFLTCQPEQIFGRRTPDRPAGDIGERRLCRLRDGRHGVHATVLTSDLDFTFARRFLEHLGEPLPRP
jgi:hypothetical protein